MDKVKENSTSGSLADYGYIAHSIERLFLGLEKAALLQRIFGLKSRGEHHKDLAKAAEPERFLLVKEHARRSDNYLVSIVAVEMLLIFVAVWSPFLYDYRSFAIVVASVCWYRLIDIVQLIANRLIFGPLRGFQQNRMSSGVRTLIVTVIYYAEIALIFAILYFIWRCDFKDGCRTAFDCLYFSGITQLTIGYGDILPQHGLRALAITQGTLGFLFGVILVARLISELPKVSGDLESPSTELPSSQTPTTTRIIADNTHV